MLIHLHNFPLRVKVLFFILLQHYANFLFSVNVSLRTLTNWGGGREVSCSLVNTTVIESIIKTNGKKYGKVDSFLC